MRRLSDQHNIMSKYVGLWNRICKFFNHKSDSEGYTKTNTEGMGNGVSRNYLGPESLVYMNDGRIITLRELYSKKPVFTVINKLAESDKLNSQNKVGGIIILN